jgi:N6-L-threonylcarbamoyladenine synthase
MRILAIETSCDETAVAIVDVDEGGKFVVLSNETLSQAMLHSEYGGVFPALAKREHARTIAPLLSLSLRNAALAENGGVVSEEARAQIAEILAREPELTEQFMKEVGTLKKPVIDRIVVTRGPGLEPALWVGINTARALGALWGIPVIPANHMEGHILAALFDQKTQSFPHIGYPLVALLISGGHTELVRVDAIGSYGLLGETQDDAVGECFDKVARMLGLPYPGGPQISRIALSGHSGVYPLPRPMLHSGDLNFSFSGLKTSVLYLTKKLGELSEQVKADIAREFEDSVSEVIVAKSLKALRDTGAQGLVVGGGVSANDRIRASLKALTDKEGLRLFVPDRVLSTDNALMIALAGSFERSNSEALIAKGNWKIHS